MNIHDVDSTHVKREERGATRRAAALLGRLIGNQRALYALGWVLWVFIFCQPIALGLLGEAYFDGLQGVAGAPALGIVLGLLALWLVQRVVFIQAGMWFYAPVPFRAGANLQQNMFSHLLERPGAQPPPFPSGEVVTRFRDDVEHTTETVDHTVDLSGGLIVGVISFVLMARIDVALAVVAFIPVVGVVAVVRLLGPRIEQAAERARATTQVVTGFLGEAFGGVQAVKVAGAEQAMADALVPHNDVRRAMMVRDRTLEATAQAAANNTTNLGLGLVLVLAVGTLGTEAGLSVGEFALFTYLLGLLSIAATMIGFTLAKLQQTGVSAARMRELVEPHDLPWLARPRDFAVGPTGTTGDASPLATTASMDPIPGTALLAVRGLTHDHHQGTASEPAGVLDANLEVHRGAFVVVTGPVGSGKTTLLRTILGLLPAQEGRIEWMGRAVEDPATVMVPPLVAYTPQVPRLFSMSLRDNLAMGLGVGPDDLRRSLHAAAFGPDLQALPHGLDTLVGTNGMRLSGGQAQRTAAARMLVRRPRLLVVDDVSSALDVETEAQLWDELFRPREDEPPATALVVSHRRPALARADHVVVLDAGRIVAQGTARELRASSELFRRLWG